MKQKIFKILTLVFFISSFLLPFIFVEKAQAACSYRISRFDSKGKTTASVNETINFIAVVERSGTLSDCASEMRFELYAKDNGGFNGAFNGFFIEGKAASFKSNTATVEFNTDLKKIDLTKLSTPTQPAFYVKAMSNNFITLEQLVSSPVVITVSGVIDSSSPHLKLRFEPAQNSYSLNQEVKIWIDAKIFTNTTRINHPDVNEIYAVAKAGGANGTILSDITVSADNFSKYEQNITIKLAKSLGINVGSNNINVSLWNSKTSLKLGEANLAISVAGSTAMGVQTNVTTLKPDSDLIFSITNSAGKNLRGTIEVNGTSNSFGSLPFTLKTSTANGFVNGRNTITVKALDNATGQAVTLENSGQLTITVDPNATPTTTTTKKYACKAGDGKYACSASNDPGLGDVYAQGGGCNAMEVQQVELCWCGKTDDQIKTQCTSTSNPTLPTDKLMNPIPTEGLLDTFLGITKGFLAGLAIWAVIAIIFAGFRMVISAGNEEAITQAKKAITWAILGLVIALLSFSMVAIVQNILNVDTTKFNPQLPGSTTPPTSPPPSGYNIPPNKNI